MHTTERLRCRCCGIGSPDVGFLVLTNGSPDWGTDLLCDACETALRQHLADFAVRSMLRAVAKARTVGAL